MTYWNAIHHHEPEEIWMSHPRVRARINERISGDPGKWPLDLFAQHKFSRLPFEAALSIGCGVGDLERDLVRRNIVHSVIGIDTAELPLDMARAAAQREGMSDRIKYIQNDARDYLRAVEKLDAIFFHASLHHFDNPGALLTRAAEVLRPDGLLYLDEYIGPSRHEWSWRLMALFNLIYYMLPKATRRARIIRRPINHSDPTEAVASGEIIKGVNASFKVLDRRDYGGNLLSVLYPNLYRLDAGIAASTQADAAINFLLDSEDVLLRNHELLNVSSYFTVIVATPLGNTVSL